MDPLTGAALIGTGGAAAGGVMGYFGQREANTAASDIADKTNYANRQNAQEQMAFQENMSSSAYQRAMRDMKLAGLNPMLAYQQGGASTPGGAMATAQMAPVGNAGEKLGEGLSNAAKNYAQFSQAAKQIQQQGEMNQSNIDINKNQAGLIRENQKLTAAKAVTELHSARAAKQTADLLETQTPIAKGLSKTKQYLELLDMGARTGNNATGAISNLISPQLIRDIVFPKIPKGSKTYDPKTTGTFDKKSGEIIDGSSPKPR